MRVGSLFAGIGGIDLGLERAGFEVIWQVEKDQFCRDVLAKHWPTTPRHVLVEDVGADNLEECDVICGGFPCQDISTANPDGLGLDGARSGLWFEFARIVRELRPRYVFVENVPVLTTRGLERVLGALAEMGYDAEWFCVPASAFGAPHLRWRMFIVAYTECGSLRQQQRGGAGRVGPIRHSLQSMPRHNLWPTPVAKDAQGARNATSVRQPGSSHNDGRTLTDAVIMSGDATLEETEKGNRVVGGALNPRWVEWLMGFPVGWTALKR